MASEKTIMHIIMGVLLAPLFLALLIMIMVPLLWIMCPFNARCGDGCDYTYCYLTLAAPFLIGALFLLTRRRRLR